MDERVPADLTGGDEMGEVGEGVAVVAGEGVVGSVGDVAAVDRESGAGVAHGGAAGAAEQIQQARPSAAHSPDDGGLRHAGVSPVP
ncbi:hypothetical protein H4K38_19505 [Streptomyces sp. I3(2020)]|nr:hypothetical protein [Streptomyces sp. I3(2020)]